MRKTIPAWLIACALLLTATSAGSEDEWAGSSPTPETVRAIELVVGNPDPAAVQRLAGVLAPPQLIAAIHRGDRTQRLAALEACGHLADPWPVLPYLAAVMSARERQAASRATEALLTDLARESSAPDRSTDLVPGQAAQLGRLLHQIVGRTDFLGIGHHLLGRHRCQAANLAQHRSGVAYCLDNVAGAGLTLGADHGRALADPP